MAEIDARIAHARRELLRLQDNRRRGVTELETVAELAPIVADLQGYCAHVIDRRLKQVR